MAKGDSNQLCTILNSSVRRVPPATDPQMGEPRAVSRTKRRLLGAGEEMQPSEAGEDVCTLRGWAQSQWRKQVPRELCPQDQDWTQGPVTAAFPAPQPPPAPWLRVTHSRAGGGRKEPGGGRQEGRGWVAGPSPAARSSSSAVTGRRTPARRRAGAEGGQEAQPPGGAATASPAQPGTSEEVRSEDMSCWTKHEILRGRSTLPRTWMGLWAALSSWVATGPLARDKEAGTRQDTG